MTEKDQDDLSRRLKTWVAPETPPRVDQRVLDMYDGGRWKETAWRRWLSGSVRVPVPVALAACLLFAVTLAFAMRPRSGEGQAPPGSTISAPARPEPEVETHAAEALVGFEPAKEMKVTILNRGDLR